ncbi:Lrp/AsnC family transcriptional regulator [Candidatus Woesearchaeota archaeon]|nr:Lrp/AsnC family transcriptional regulator [Candidatus Woesearchaeota archaeon]
MDIIDEIDKRIIELLKDNAKLSTRAIGKKTGIPITTVYHRIRKLEQQGIIKKYTAIIDEEKLGRGLCGYTLIHYDASTLGDDKVREDLKKKLCALPEVEEIKYLTGRFDILLKARAKDIKEFGELLSVKLHKIPGVKNSETFFVINDIK